MTGATLLLYSSGTDIYIRSDLHQNFQSKDNDVCLPLILMFGKLQANIECQYQLAF